MKKIFIILIVCCLFLGGCGNSTNKEKVDDHFITTEEVNKISENINDETDTYIVDVRTADEYSAGHIKGSVNIPLDSIDDIDYSKSSKIIVYCRSGARSSEALSTLISMGYTNVFDMGGIINYTYELEK